MIIPKDFQVRIPNSYVLDLYGSDGLQVSRSLVDFVMTRQVPKPEGEDMPQPPVPANDDKSKLGVQLALGGGRLWSDDVANGRAGYGLLSVKLHIPDFKLFRPGIELMFGGSSESYNSSPTSDGPNSDDPFG